MEGHQLPNVWLILNNQHAAGPSVIGGGHVSALFLLHLSLLVSPRGAGVVTKTWQSHEETVIAGTSMQNSRTAPAKRPYRVRVTAMLQATSSRETRDSAREVKFLLPADRAALVLDWARSRLGPDPHAGGPSGDEYRTTTIYFDTRQRAVYQRQGSYGRSKYRVRRYGASDVAYLERKLRTGALLSKRRTACAVAEIASAIEEASDWQVRWFSQRIAMRQLAPVCQVSYRRHARVGMGPYGPMRLTFDEHLLAQPNGTCNFAADNGVPVLTGQVIMEMKYCVDTPAVFRHLVQDFMLSPAPISKYRLSVDALDNAGGWVGASGRVQPTLTSVSLHPDDLTGLSNA